MAALGESLKFKGCQWQLEQCRKHTLCVYTVYASTGLPNIQAGLSIDLGLHTAIISAVLHRDPLLSRPSLWSSGLHPSSCTLRVTRRQVLGSRCNLLPCTDSLQAPHSCQTQDLRHTTRAPNQF